MHVVEPGVRRAQPRGPPLRAARRRDRPGPALHEGLRRRHRPAQPALHEVDFYTSHEALILGYEEALTRQDSLTGDWYDCSAHMLWIGERTRQLDGAHVEFLRGVGNPIGCKLGPMPPPTRRSRSASALNPDRVPGRLTLDHPHGRRPGPRTACRRSSRAVRDAGPPGRVGLRSRCTATRSPPPAAARPATSTTSWPRSPASSAAHGRAGTWPGGVHVELTGDDVTECLGGAEEILDADLDARYETMCDPRLNARQSARPRVPRGRAPQSADARVAVLAAAGMLTRQVGICAEWEFLIR